MTTRWRTAALVALGMTAASCSVRGGEAALVPATTSTSAAPAATSEAPVTSSAPPSGSTTTVAPVTAAPSATSTVPPATQPVPVTAPPPTVPFTEAPPTTSALAVVRGDIGVAYPFFLATNCGITGMQFDQREWRNDPPLAAPGTRPPGWNPSYEQGTMTLTAPDVAEFTSADGLRTARFVPRPPGAPDLPPCP